MSWKKWLTQIHFSETSDTQKSTRSHAHQNLISRFLKNWYKIESQEEEEELWFHWEIISNTLVTVLIPGNSSLPEIKLNWKEIYWKYDFKNWVFTKWDEVKHELKVFKKNKDLKSNFWSWEAFDIS